MGFFTPDKALDVVKKGEELADQAFFTEQEKEGVRLEYAKIYLDTIKTTANESTDRARTRRSLAWWIMGEFLVFLALAVMVWPFSNDYAAYILSVAAVMSALVSGVGIFYFGYYGASQTISKAIEAVNGFKQSKGKVDA